MGYHKHLRSNNQRKKASFEKRYGMNAKEWSKFKKENPKEAHELYMKVGNPACK